MPCRYDYVVIGAGIMGSCTALQLVKEGHKVLQLEQFLLPHTRGSSHGATRLIRSCYPGTHFAAMMPQAFASWREIEEASRTDIFVQTGVLCVCNPSSVEVFNNIKSNMLKFCPGSFKLLTADEAASTYPTYKFPADYNFLFDETGGVILANKALSSVQSLFQQRGGHLWDGCQVSSIVPGNEIKVSTSRGDVLAKGIVVCTGAWTKKLIEPLAPELKLPLQPAAVKVHYWKEKIAGKHSFSQGCPAFIDCTVEKLCVYALAAVEYPGLMKVCNDGGVPCEPDERDRANYDLELEKKLKEYVAEHFPYLESEPAVTETCMYTLTPDEDFVLDTLPQHKNIVIGTGFSGKGFKFSPVIGKILSDLVLGRRPGHDISHFRLNRFSQH